MIVAVIPAKQQSGRLPGKNMLIIDGKTLVAHAVEFARRSGRVNKIVVSTDDPVIAQHSKTLGVEVVMRGPELGGEVPLMEVYRHAWRKLGGAGIEWIVGVQADNPDRRVRLDEALSHAEKKKIDYLFTVDAHGARNGSLVLLNERTLRGDPTIYTSVLVDSCTNIHTRLDYLKACHSLSGHAETIHIGSRPVGRGHPVFIIAEGACNHMCRVDLAKQMIDKAVEAGADSIKFQTYKAEKLVTDKAVSFWGGEQVRQIDYYRRLDRFDKEVYRELFAYAEARGIIPFSSPFDEESADMLNELGMAVFKIASCEVPNHRLIRRIAGYGKPVILSTGASQPEEIDRAVELILETGNTQLVLLSCTLSYPTPLPAANLRRISTLAERYPGFILGLSDHTQPEETNAVASVAVALGARVIEKHYTLDRSMTGSGHYFALAPHDLKRLVETARAADSVMGDGVLGVAASEEQAWNSARRSLVATRPIRKGEKLTPADIAGKRPGGGWPIEQADRIVGWIALRDIQPDERFSEEVIAPCE